MVAFVASATATNTTNTDAIAVTVTKPTGTLQGHLMIAVTHGYTADTFVPPTGWTFLGFQDDATNLRSRAYMKVAGASEPANYTFSFQPGAGGGAIGASISTFSGHGGLDTYSVYLNETTDPWDWATGWFKAPTRSGIAYEVITWRDTTSNTTTWAGSTERFDTTAGDAGLTQYRGQSGATEFSTAGVGATFSANITNSITHSIGWVFYVADAVPANESWASTGTAVELEINGTWTDVTSDIKYNNAISITRGTSTQGGQVNPSTASFTLDNSDGKYSVLNPTSVYYPYLNLSVPCRISKAYGTVAMETIGFYDVVNDTTKDVSRFRTPHVSAFNTTGDLDVRVDVEPETWKMHQVLAAKHALDGYGVGLDHLDSGWVFYLDYLGYPHLYWVESNAGNNEVHDVVATQAVGTRLRQALRVGLDVNNGASGHTVTFYTADTISGSWTQLGSAVVTAGTTSVNAESTVALSVGMTEPVLDGSPFTYYTDNQSLFREDYAQNRTVPVEGVETILTEPIWHPTRGRIYGMEMRTSLSGSVIASCDFTAQTTGTRSFSDAQGNPWLAYGQVICHNRKYRHHGEITSWPQPIDNKRDFPHVDIESTGILNRVQQGTPDESSALYRNYTAPAGVQAYQFSAGGGPAIGNFGPIYPIAYWPMEDNALPGADADAPVAEETGSGLNDQLPGIITGAVEFNADTTFFGSKSAAKFPTGSMARFPVTGAVTGAWVTEFIIYAPDGITNGTRLAEVRQSGVDRIVRLTYSATDTLVLTVHDAAGVQIDTSGSISVPMNRRHNRIAIQGWLGSYAVYVENQSARTWGSALGFAAGAAADTGAVYEVRLNANQLMNGAYLAHLAVFDGVYASTTYPYGATLSVPPTQMASPMDAWRREPAARRLERLTWEEELINYNIGSGGPEMAMQPAAPYASLLQEVQEVDTGYLYEPRGVLGMGYRTRTSMVSQPAMLTLSYEGFELSGSFQAYRDNRGAVNDITVTKEFGTTGRYVKTSGSRSALAPPNGIGRYRDGKTISLYRDRDLPGQASWRVFIGTNDDLRVDTITIALENTRIGSDSDMIYRFLKADMGHKILIEDLPLRLLPDDMSLIIAGYSETFDQFQHSITFNTVPGSTFDLAQTVVTTATTSSKADSITTTTTEALDTTETGVDVTTASGSALWTQSGVDFDIVIGGERMTVGSLVQVSDTFARTSVNSWGNADSGQTWTNTGGTASDYDVGSGVGTHAQTVANTAMQSTVTTPYTNADFDVTVTVATDKLAVGGSLFAYAVGRWADTNNMYYARLEFATSAVATLTLRKRVAGVDGVLGTFVLDDTHVAARQFTIRIQGISTAIKARAWRTGYAEPDYWQTSATDSDLTAPGQVGVRSVTSSATSNLPVTYSWDNFQTNALANQTFNVTRSVNGVVKSHASGVTVQLFKKANTALGDFYG